MSEKVVENKMGVLPIPKLLFQISTPVIISMLIQAFYNIVDSAFVAQISENALTAVSLVFPVQNLIIAIAVGTGVGVNALLARYLGAKDYKEVDAVASNGVFVSVLSGIIFGILGVLLAKPFFHVQTTNQEIFTYGVQYMTIISALSVGVFTQIIFERILQATGKTVQTMISQGIGAIVNIVLDPILIFGLLGFPKLGVAGAAIATVIGQFTGMILGIVLNHHFNKEVTLSLRRFRINVTTIKNIYKIGVPSIVVQAIGSVMTFGMNKILLRFTPTATAVFGVYFKLNSFIFMPVFGLCNGMVPIVAFNYGAKNKKRVLDTVKLSIIVAVCMMLLGLLAFLVFPAQLLGIFDASEEMLRIGVPALRIISLSFVFAGFCIVVTSFFQALGNGVYSLIVSVARQLIAILPIAALFAYTIGLDAVWWSIPIAELVSLTLSILLFIRIYKEKIKPLGK